MGRTQRAWEEGEGAAQVFGSNRSPRSQDVQVCVWASVCVIFFRRALRMALKGFCSILKSPVGF